MFTWSYTDIPSLDHDIIENHIDMLIEVVLHLKSVQCFNPSKSLAKNSFRYFFPTLIVAGAPFLLWQSVRKGCHTLFAENRCQWILFLICKVHRHTYPHWKERQQVLKGKKNSSMNSLSLLIGYMWDMIYWSVYYVLCVWEKIIDIVNKV